MVQGDGGRSFMTIGSESSTDNFSCRSEKKEVYGLFALQNYVPSSTFSGTENFGGVQANVFLTTLPKCYFNVVPAYDCVIKTYAPAEGGAAHAPAILGVTATFTSSSIPNMTTKLVFEDITLDPPSFPEGMRLPSRCLDGPPPPVCPAGPVVRNFQTYKNLNGSASIINENSADIVGEAAWLCMHGPAHPNDPAVTRYTVDVNTTWGLYAQCNEQMCFNPSPPTPTVGRQCPGCNDPRQSGQCDPDLSKGAWFSWDESTRCQQGQDPEGGGCAWLYHGPVKTIAVSCIASQGFFKLCSNLTQAAEALQGAFDTHCPPI